MFILIWRLLLLKVSFKFYLILEKEVFISKKIAFQASLIWPNRKICTLFSNVQSVKTTKYLFKGHPQN